MNHKKGRSLRSLQIDRIWPVLSTESLSYLELQQDPYFIYIPQEQIQACLNQAIAHGQELANRQPRHTNYKNLLNDLLRQRITIRFHQQHPTNPTIRAQYTRKPPTIEIFRNSIQQMQSFFEQSISAIDEEELISLHLYHELFHHLENQTKANRIRIQCTIKQWGPFAIKKELITVREIAAHAFTQSMMKLNWSPLLIDRLIDYFNQGWTNEQIREHFAKVKQEVQALEPQEEFVTE